SSRYSPDIRAPIAASSADYVKFMGRDVSLGEVTAPTEQQPYYNPMERYRGRILNEEGRYMPRGPGGGYGGGGYGGGGYGGGGYGGGGYGQAEDSGFEQDVVPGEAATPRPRLHAVTSSPSAAPPPTKARAASLI